ncbi:MAG: ABC transporter ATP-binding protein [Limnochordia bacterium]|nr:ABC transporter ATP-binding protein [Limnochordia bacterium]
MLKVNGVTKTYKGKNTPAVVDLDFEVKPGEIFGFLGPNGAGKTITIKMIVGLLLPDAGSIEVADVDVIREPLAAKRLIGYVPDEPSLYERLTGAEFLNFVADAHQLSKSVRQERIAEFLHTFGLEHAANDLISSYSHGMQQKLALTAALMHNPPLFILDEPMVGLDPRSSSFFKDLLRSHCDEGNAVFFSTHILEVAERICDRVGIISHGKLIACGPVEEIVKAGRTLEEVFLALTVGDGDGEA